VLLANVGSPDGPDPASVRRFLREFLSDPQVVELPRAVWLPILLGLVLPLRSRSSARLYARIWTAEGSPLIVNSRRQQEGLARRLGPDFRVATGMRYGAPSLAAAFAELEELGCRTVVLAPMFPQHSFSTTGSILAEGARVRSVRAGRPGIRALGSFCEDAGYVRALAARVREARGNAAVDHHVFSFHGLPEKSVARGDPYRGECERTARALARELGLAEGSWTLAFQSRFGPGWLRPFTDEVARALATRVRTVLIATPGFTADCLETLEEIGIRLRETFHAAGGRDLIVAPALNEHPTWLDALAELVRRTAGNASAT
jgi:ferrochelatase